jgi:hypothetical protein
MHKREFDDGKQRYVVQRKSYSLTLEAVDNLKRGGER